MRLVLNFGLIKVPENDGGVASGDSIFPHLLYITFAFSWLIFLLSPVEQRVAWKRRIALDMQSRSLGSISWFKHGVA